MRIRAGALGLLLLSAGCGGGAAEAPPPVPPVSAGPAAEPPSLPPLPPLVIPPPPAGDLLDHPVSVDFRDQPFRHAVATLSRLSGAALAWEPDLTARTLEAPVTLSVRDMPLRHACRWLARLVGCRAVSEADLDGKGTPGIRFGLPEDTAPEDGAWSIHIVDVGSLVALPPPESVAVQRKGSYDRLVGRHTAPLPEIKVKPGEPTQHVRAIGDVQDPIPAVLEELEQDLRSGAQEEARYRSAASRILLDALAPLVYRSPAHPDPVRFLPGSLSQLMVDQPVLGRAWVADAIKGFISPRPPSGMSQADEAAEEAMEAKLKTQVALPAGEFEVGEAVDRLAREAGINLGWDVREAGGALLRRIRWPGGRMSLAAALELLIKRAGFTAFRQEPGAGIWLLGPLEAAHAADTLWTERVTLGVYPVADLDQAMGVDTLRALIHRRLPPGTWDEPGAVLAYHLISRRLLVRQRPEVHAQIHAILRTLRREGTDAVLDPRAP